MEYILFAAGIIIILISLFLTYYSQPDKDEYYLEHQILSELKNIKDDLGDSLESIVDDRGNFDEILQEKISNQKCLEESNVLKVQINELAQELAVINNKIDKLEEKIDNNFKNISNVKSESGIKSDKLVSNPIYQKIKKFKKEGFSLGEIARKLNMGSREIELIYKLNSRGEE